METFLLIFIVVILLLIAYKINQIHIVLLDKNSDEDIVPHQVDENDYENAKSFITSTGKASTSSLQTNFKWGYFKTAMIMKKLEEDKIIGNLEQGKRYREILNK